MEKVQFQLESTLPEVRDLHEKGLFTKHELDEITRRRTRFESSLIRRAPRKEDFFKYAEYEINLERLRRVRYRRMKYHLNPPPPSASSYSIPRRALYILKRATVKFPADLSVWLAYVEYASREGMRKVVSQGLTSALQHHPLSSTLYLLSSYHHLHPDAPFPSESIPSTSKVDLPSQAEDTGFSLEGVAPARTTLLLGLRLVPQSQDLWVEYIKLELGWVEALRRRWKLLGIEDTPKASSLSDDEVESDALIGGEGAFGPEGETARKAILSGQLVVHAVSSALEAIPAVATDKKSPKSAGMSLRNLLLDTLRTYPSPLRATALEPVYADLSQLATSTGRIAAEARLLLMTRGLFDRPYESQDAADSALDEVQTIEEIGKIGRAMKKEAKRLKGDAAWLEVAGGWLVDQAVAYKGNADLQAYLLGVLAALTKPSLAPPADLLVKRLDLLSNSPSGSEGILSTARAYASVHPSNPHLAKRVIALEVQHEPDVPTCRSNCQKAIAAIVKAAQPSDVEQTAIAQCCISCLESERVHLDAPTFDKIVKKYLRDSLRWSHLPELHSQLLCWQLDRLIKVGSFLDFFQHAIVTYRPSAEFYRKALQAVVEQTPSDMASLKRVYQSWRAWCKTLATKVDAAETYMEALMQLGRGRDAHDEYERAKREVGQDVDALQRLEDAWRALLESLEKGDGPAGSQSDSGGSDDDTGSERSQGADESDVSMSDE